MKKTFNVFQGKHLSDEEIFFRIEKILEERNRINNNLKEINEGTNLNTIIDLTNPHARGAQTIMKMGRQFDHNILQYMTIYR